MPKSHVPPELIETADCRYGRMRFLKNDDTIGRSLRLYGEWAEAEIELAQSFLTPGDTVLDIGSNIGTHALAFAELVGDSGHVICFEPHPVNFELLSANVRTNSLTQIQLHQWALSKASGRLWMSIPDLNSSSNLGALRAEVQSRSEIPIFSQFEVEAVRLDDVHFGPVAFIKIDVEGMELMVLQGGSRILSEQRPVVMAESNLMRDSWPVADYLLSLNYEVWLHYTPSFRRENFRREQQNMYGMCGEANLLGIPREQLHRFTIPHNLLPQLRPISDVDALAAAMLQKPQYCEYLTSAYDCDKTGGYIATIAALRDEISNLRNSASMKITKPVRYLAKHLRHLTGKSPVSEQ